MDFLLFSAKDDKPEAPSDSPISHKILWGVLFVKSRGCGPRCDGLSQIHFQIRAVINHYLIANEPSERRPSDGEAAAE